MKELNLRQCFLMAGTFVASVVACFGMPQAQAQEELVIEEIIVTSQRRQESVQDVPIAVNAFSDTMIRNSGVDDIKELTQLAPALQASSTNSEMQGTVIRIRGVGTQGNNPAFESAVGVFVDGVYRSRPGAALAEFLDVERVEVMRGPQGTLFGRNTSAGAISIVTAKPQFELGGYVEASFGNFNSYDVRGSIWGPLIDDKLAVSLSGLAASRDGLLDDLTSGTDINTRDRYTVRGQALFTPNEDVELRVIADARSSDEDCCYAVAFAERPPGASTPVIITNILEPGGQVTPPNPYARQANVTSGRPLQHDVDDFGISAELTWQLGNVELTSITSYRDFESDRHQDIDFTAADYLDNIRKDKIENFTQEIRLAGENGRLNWIVGAFYADETITLDSTLIHGAQYESFINFRLGPIIAALYGPTGLVAPLGATNYTELANIMSGGAVAPGTGWADGTGAVGDHFASDNSSFAIFTHNVIELTDQLDLTLGLRWTQEDKRGMSNLNNDPANTPGCNAILPTAIAPLPNFTLADFGLGDDRRIKDVLSSLGCLGITSPGFEYNLEQNDDEASGILGLSYTTENDVLVYGSYSRGFKAGGINLDRAGTTLSLTGDNMNLEGLDNFLDPRFKPETVDAYELGVKSSLLDGRMFVNMALFHEEFENFQLNTFTGFSFIPETVEEVITTGFEFDLQARVTEYVDVLFGYAYIDTEYGDNLTDVSNKLANERGFRTGTTLLNEVSALSGRQLTNAPRTVLTGSLTWNQPVSSNLEFLFNATARWQDDINTGSDLDPEKDEDDYTIVNARIGLMQAEGTWSVELWGNNLFDEEFAQVAFDIPLQSNAGFGAFLGEQATYGLTLRYNF